MIASEFISKKRDGGEHSSVELRDFLHGYLDGEVKDYQMSAWLMAVYFNGLTSQETQEWTRLMWQSGRTFPRHDRNEFWVDKHSTGGVGDKTSLILVPLVTSIFERLGKYEVRIPMVSGRGLGHTGGTLDKLEAVPGFNCRVPFEKAVDLLERNKFFMMGQTEEMAPADRLLYSLRDVTGTVDSIALIVSSIMSKKLAENLNGLVFDVKFGNGAFMQDETKARNLAKALREVAQAHKVDSVSVLSRMEEPLGVTVGHHLEIEECADFLEGHTRDVGMLEVCRELTGWMVHLASGKEISFDDARTEFEKELATERPFELFKLMFESQGGSWNSFLRQRNSFGEKVSVFEWKPSVEGWIHQLSARSMANLVLELGGGRQSKEDKINPFVGLRFQKKVGDFVRSGETVLKVFFAPGFDVDRIESKLNQAIQINETPISRGSWILDTYHE